MASLTSMLKITRVKPLAKGPIFINKDRNIDETDSGVKSKNITMINYLIKSKSLIEPSFRVSFLNFGARLIYQNKTSIY